MASTPRTLSAPAFRWFAFASFLSMILIVLSGAAVRLTGSGLGCPDWPTSVSYTHLAGEPELIIEATGSVDPAAFAALLGCEVRSDGPSRVRCAVASSPERIATVSTYLTSVGLSMVSLRTRASLEERYLDLIADERNGPRP